MGLPPDAYFAGHFDGEGCVRICCRDKKLTYWRVVITVSICHRETLDRYASRFGGIVKKRTATTGKQQWHWSISTFNLIQPFIEAILPFSIEKKPQLALALDWMRKRAEHPRQPVPPWVHQLGGEYSRRLSMMKRQSSPDRP